MRDVREAHERGHRKGLRREKSEFLPHQEGDRDHLRSASGRGPAQGHSRRRRLHPEGHHRGALREEGLLSVREVNSSPHTPPGPGRGALRQRHGTATVGAATCALHGYRPPASATMASRNEQGGVPCRARQGTPFCYFHTNQFILADLSSMSSRKTGRQSRQPEKISKCSEFVIFL